MDAERIEELLGDILLLLCPNCGVAMEEAKDCPNCSHTDDAIYDCGCEHCIGERASWNLSQLSDLENEYPQVKVRIAE